MGMLLRIMDSYFGQKHRFEVKNINTQLFISQDSFFVSCVGLILTAPIHCRGPIGEQVIQIKQI